MTNQHEARFGQLPFQVQLLLRAAWIAQISVRFVLSGIFTFLYFRVFYQRDKAVCAVGNILTNFAEALGPAGIKLAQVASYRPDLIPSDLIEPLQRVQDQAGSLCLPVSYNSLQAAFDEPIEVLFESIDTTPIAAGSVAVLLRARGIKGENIAIKALRPDAEKLISLDLAFIRNLVKLSARLNRFNGIPILETFDIFAEMIRAQCDMRVEADNAIRILGMVGREVSIPVPIRHLTSRTVLVMQYLPSSWKITDNQIPTSIYRPACRALLRDLYRMIFITGLVHGDLHPGNVGVAHDGRVILYDFGLIASLSNRDRILFRNFFMAVIKKNSKQAALHIIESAERRPEGLDFAQFAIEVNSLLDRYSGRRAGDFFVYGFVTELFQLERNHGVYGPPGFANAVWALAMFEGLVRTRYPTLDFQAEAESFVRPELSLHSAHYVSPGT